MNNFVYQMPTRAYFGRSQIENLGAAIKEFNGSKVLIAYGGGSIKKNGIYDAVAAQLKENRLEFAELSDIKPNPRIESVKEGVDTYLKEGCDFILAMGGEVQFWTQLKL